jgi:methionyl-tRNA synthetase
MVKNEQTGQGEKMSKSRGNAIAPADVIDLLGVEGYRYYFMTDCVPGEDGAISYSRMEQVYNADLANSWGNLVSRSLNMSAKYFDGKTPELPEGWADRDNPLRQIAQGIEERYASCMSVFDYVGAKDAIMELVHAANHYIEDSAPWTVAKDPARASELEQIITNLLESIRICAHLFVPFMPQTSAEVLRRMSLEAEADTTDLSAACAWGGLVGGVPVTKGSALFPRLGGKK